MLKKTSKAKKLLDQIATLIAEDVTIDGDVHVCGGIQIDGTVKGSVISEDGNTIIRLSQRGSVHGEIRAPNVIINGRVEGNVFSGEQLELAENAVVHGDVHYRLLEIRVGAQVTGKLVHDAGRTISEDQPNDAMLPFQSLKSIAGALPEDGPEDGKMFKDQAS